MSKRVKSTCSTIDKSRKVTSIDSQLNDSTETSCKCSLCSKRVTDDEHALECEYCSGWIHAKCAGINDTVYKSIDNIRCFKFFCDNCHPKIDRLLKIERRMNEMEARFEELSVRVSNSSVVLPVAPQKSGSVFQTPTKPFNVAVQEAVELKLKSHNAVLFGVPETGDDDLKTVRDLLTIPAAVNDAQLKPSEILYTFRDGPQLDGKPRFLKVVCVTSQAKQNFINFVNKTAKPASAWPLRARPDLTYQQRQNGKKLREKLDEFGKIDHFINYQKNCIFHKPSKMCVYSLDLLP